MNELIKQGIITELSRTQNVQYLFNDSDTFSLTEYKVLRGQSRNFLKCYKVLFNGKIKLIYFSSLYKSLKSMINNIDIDTFFTILVNVLSCMIEIRNNGFLSCNDLDLSVDKIFVDQNTMEVYLVYLPINDSAAETLSTENEFRSEMIKMIRSVPNFSGEKAERVCMYLANGTVTLESLQQSIKSEINSFVRKKVSVDAKSKFSGKEQEQPTMRFSCINSSLPTVFVVDRPEFIIGKNASKVHGTVTFNQAISRVHCKITFEHGKYFITDLGSANGTYINSKRLSPHLPTLLSNGVVVRLANSDFKVEY